jgi:hypothetical protein
MFSNSVGSEPGRRRAAAGSGAGRCARRGAAAAAGGGGDAGPAREHTVAAFRAPWRARGGADRGGNDNADGIVGVADGPLYAKEQRNRVDIDLSGKVTPFIEGTQAPGRSRRR